MSEIYKGVPQYGDGRKIYNPQFGPGREFSLVHYGEIVGFDEIQEGSHIIAKVSGSALQRADFFTSERVIDFDGYVEGLAERQQDGSVELWSSREAKGEERKRFKSTQMRHRVGNMFVSSIENKPWGEIWVRPGGEGLVLKKEHIAIAYRMTPALEDPIE